MHVTLKSDVTEAKIKELEDRLNTRDEISGELHPEYEITTTSSSKIVGGQETTESVITDYILSIENSLLTLTNKETSISYHFLKIE